MECGHSGVTSLWIGGFLFLSTQLIICSLIIPRNILQQLLYILVYGYIDSISKIVVVLWFSLVVAGELNMLVGHYEQKYVLCVIERRWKSLVGDTLPTVISLSMGLCYSYCASYHIEMLTPTIIQTTLCVKEKSMQNLSVAVQVIAKTFSALGGKYSTEPNNLISV